MSQTRSDLRTIQPSARIALLSDIHGTSSDLDLSRLRARRLQQAIEAINGEGPDAVLVAGDLTENGDREDLAGIRTRLDLLNAPWYAVPGNHDVGPKAGIADDQPTSIGTAAYEEVMGPSCYTATVGPVRITGLNTSLLGSGLPEESAQWRTVERDAEPLPGPFRILLLHYPLFADHEREEAGSYWSLDPEPRQRLMAAILRADHHLIVSGHLHRPFVREWRGRALIGAPAIAFGLPPNDRSVGWMRLTVGGDGRVTAEERPLAVADEVR